ncbi:80 kDa nuclear cap-binding protein [Aphelenchoides bicaudatus]|nr:80 kDa nuclear cap-binding protein [Aphelenchoides bicaudatus]
MVKRGYEDDENQEKRRRMGEEGDGRDIGSDLVELITKVNENTNISEAIEALSNKLADQLNAYEDQIIEIISDCVAYAPEKMTIFSTLVGLLNSKSNAFGDSLISKLTSDLKQRLDQDEYDIAIRVVTFFADLGNSAVLTVDSIVQFLFVFLDSSTDQNLLSDFYIYCIMHSLPWVGGKIAATQPAELQEIMSLVEKYLISRQKNHMKILNVWEKTEAHEQEDYLDNLWIQLKNLQGRDWQENHITRYYNDFAQTFAETISHNLPSIQLPTFNQENFKYPLPYVVFRLFDKNDCPDEESQLPDSHEIERFLIEEDLNWIISNNYLNIRLCTRELLKYHKRTTVPLNHMIVETVFSQLLRLPKAPHLELFYGALLIELCRVESSSMPPLLADAAESFYKRARSLHPACLDRLVNWFSYHLSNFEYRWSWTDWSDSVNLPTYDRRQIFVREVFEKCLRLSYHDKLLKTLPEDFEPLVPVKTQVVFVLGESSHPAYGQAQMFRRLIQDRVESKEVLLELKADRLATDADATYDADMVAVFTAVLIDVSSKTFSHTFAAFTRYVEVFRRVCGGNREMQSTVLRTVFDCWCKHKQMLEMLVDKFIKMRIVEPISVVNWVFCDDMKNEFHRSWVWSVINVAIFRLDCHATNTEQELVQLKKQVDRQEKFGDSDDLDDVRELLLLVCHNFTVRLTELMSELNDAIEERSEEVLLQFEFVLGRFKHVLLANLDAMWKYIEVLNQELFSLAEIDPKIVEVYNEFRSLKHS